MKIYIRRALARESRCADPLPRPWALSAYVIQEWERHAENPQDVPRRFPAEITGRARVGGQRCRGGFHHGPSRSWTRSAVWTRIGCSRSIGVPVGADDEDGGSPRPSPSPPLTCLRIVVVNFMSIWHSCTGGVEARSDPASLLDRQKDLVAGEDLRVCGCSFGETQMHLAHAMGSSTCFLCVAC